MNSAFVSYEKLWRSRRVFSEADNILRDLCNFSRVCLLVKMALKTVTRSILQTHLLVVLLFY